MISNLPLALFVLFLLLLCSAFFSGSETALTRARRVRLRVMSKQGNRGAKQADLLLLKPEQMLATILLGNNFVNIAASALATVIFVHQFGETGILYSTIAMTLVVLIFSEILPKSIAVAHAEAISCYVATPMRGIQWLFSPLLRVILYITHTMRRLFQVPEGEAQPALTHQELATMIDMSAETGMLDEAREQMLASSLQLHEIPVKQIMSPRTDIILLNGRHSVQECLTRAVSSPHSRYPVYIDETDHIIGIIHLRRLIKLKESSKPLVEATIWHTPPFVPNTRNALSQLFDFQRNHEHMAIVVDELGDIDGLITLEDIIEEIVGEIEDESDLPPETEIWPQPDGSFVVTATAGLHDINQQLDIELPEEGATTIGGLITEILGAVPEGKACLTINTTRLEILSLDQLWIKRVRIIASER
ncbi:MAG: CNNM domain-containing protein [Mariprofundales bacterium]|nr:CNNM domain-containing protein [Mariprofundales bacterium]